MHSLVRKSSVVTDSWLNHLLDRVQLMFTSKGSFISFGLESAILYTSVCLPALNLQKTALFFPLFSVFKVFRHRMAYNII